MDIKYLIGDATVPYVKENDNRECVIAHICNDIGAWGSGFVIAVSNKWQKPREEYLRNSVFGNLRLGDTQIVKVREEPCTSVANMIAQHGIRSGTNTKPLQEDYLEIALKKLCIYAKMNDATVHMPRIGCDRAGGKWEDVEPIIKRTLSDEGVEVIIYDLK